MMTKKILMAVIMAFLTVAVKGQGCSDAGFCTLEAFRPQADTVHFRNKLRVGLNAGSADHSITIFGSYVEFNRQIAQKLFADIKVTMVSQSGNGISVAGISDVFFNLNYRATKRFTLTAGLKIPLTDADKSKDGYVLPMDYQSSLGTLDLIVGAGYQFRKLQFVAAYQQPLTQNNNTFRTNDANAGLPIAEFQSTNKFHRKGDVLVRASYPIQASKRIAVTPSLLPVFHLGKDSFVNEFGRRKEIDGSSGLTLNANLYLDFAVTPASTIQLSLGAPFIVREARPDGLTRSFIVNLEYAIRL